MAIIWTDCGQNGLDAQQMVWMWDNFFSSRDTVSFRSVDTNSILISCSIDKEKKKWRS